MRSTFIILCILYFGMIILFSCKKEIIEKNAANPFDSVDYSNDPNNNTTNLNPNTIEGIHKSILQPRCATPGCHDGHFEPDFRTIQSSYATLVWNKVTKNNNSSSFKFRVVPYDFQNSWLHERLITKDATIGQMPLYSTPLNSGEVNQIKSWIQNGAKDYLGNSPAYPNSEPQIQYFVMFNNLFNYRYDTIRVGGVQYNSVLLEPSVSINNTTVNVMVPITDDSTASSALINTKIKLSLNENDFTNPLRSISGGYFSSANAWRFIISPSGLPIDTPIYMRVYTNDGDHPNDTQFPTNNLIHEYKSYWSFILD